MTIMMIAMPKVTTDTEKTILKILAVAFAALAGALQQQSGITFGVLTAIGLALQALTVSGLTRADWIKAAMKLCSQVSTTVGSALVMQHHAGAVFMVGTVLVAIGPALTVATMPAPGTAAKLSDGLVVPIDVEMPPSGGN